MKYAVEDFKLYKQLQGSNCTHSYPILSQWPSYFKSIEIGGNHIT